MTYDDFKKLHPVVVAQLQALKLNTTLEQRAQINYSRKKRLGLLYHTACVVEAEGLMSFAPPAKPIPKPEPKPIPKPEPISESSSVSAIKAEIKPTLTSSKSRLEDDGKEESQKYPTERHK